MNKNSLADLFYRMLTVLVLFTLILGVTPPRVARATVNILYVAPGGLTNGVCDSWVNACELRYALVLAVYDDELWVMQGIYKPTTSNSRTISFQLKSGVELYGGFDGDETSRDQRDWVSHPTILSGDIGLPGDNSDNSYHVFNHPQGLNLDSSAILDGFLIQDGNANYYTDARGGGMLNIYSSPTLANITFSNNSGKDGGGMASSHSSPTLSHVTFSNNSAQLAYSGGGMYNWYSSPTLTDVTFSNNSAGGGGGMFNYSSSPTLTNVTFSNNSANLPGGGGMYNHMSSSPTLTNVTFSNNSAGLGGGGMYNSYSSSPMLTNITFSGNTAIYYGGGIYNFEYSSPLLTNVIFYGNSAGMTAPGFGGGMYNDDSSPLLTNVTFSGNIADYGGAISNSYPSLPTLTNCILWGDLPDEIYNLSYDISVTYSDIQGGCPANVICSNVIDADPLFVNPDSGDMRLLQTSPANDAADNTQVPPDSLDLDGDGDIAEPLPYDIMGNPRFIDNPEIPDTGFGTPPIVDMGAYEYNPNPPSAFSVYLPVINK